MRPLREWGGDSLIVTYDPEEGSRLALEVGYRLARARVLMAKAGDGEVDSEAVRTQVERALAEMVEVRKVKSQLTGAKTSIDNAYGIVEAIAARVRCHLQEIDSLVLPAVGEGSDAPPARAEDADQGPDQPALGAL